MRAGEKILLRGKSGAGKTSFLKLISGVLLPSEGDLLLFGENLKKLSGSQRDQFRAKSVSFIFQSFNLINYLSVLQNIRLVRNWSTQRTEDKDLLRLFESFQLSQEISKRFPFELSKGEQQRVAAIRALASGAPLILADEPTSSLDEENAGIFTRVLEEFLREDGRSLIWVSHQNLEFNFDREIEISDWKVGT
ncbi:MAG: ATP-binding cassette domain-containing protein [Bradymonadales bacterium]|nr:MAG: ATP-binding cassette domain-containing protein [Bradymonadales bacterium]